jgi:hypothetical protein
MNWKKSNKRKLKKKIYGDCPKIGAYRVGRGGLKLESLLRE